MARVEKADVQAWVERTKLTVEALDDAMLSQLEAQVMGQLGGSFDTSGWTSPTNTPVLVKSVIAIKYASWLYNRAYSEDQESLNDYALWLLAQANDLLAGILSGSIILEGVPTSTTDGPSFYPNDASSALCPTFDDPSLGGPKFSMGGRF